MTVLTLEESAPFHVFDDEGSSLTEWCSQPDDLVLLRSGSPTNASPCPSHAAGPPVGDDYDPFGRTVVARRQLRCGLMGRQGDRE